VGTDAFYIADDPVGLLLGPPSDRREHPRPHSFRVSLARRPGLNVMPPPTQTMTIRNGDPMSDPEYLTRGLRASDQPTTSGEWCARREVAALLPASTCGSQEDPLFDDAKAVAAMVIGWVSRIDE
jgi:hypothetical protein